jgi:hypothetical protein
MNHRDLISALLLRPYGYSEVQKLGDTETFLSPEVLENVDKNFQEELLKKDELKPAKNKAFLKEDSVERYDELHKTVKPNPLMPLVNRYDSEYLATMDSSGRTPAENKYAYSPSLKKKR